MKTNRPKLSIEEVMQQVAEKAAPLAEHMYLDRDWVWYAGPSLQGEANKPHREALKEIGFRFSPGGHLMPDGETLGNWGHSCLRPMFPKRRGVRPKMDDCVDALSGLAAFGL